MNTSTQPAEGAGRSKARSKAAGELTLGLMSGGERSGTSLGFRLLGFFCFFASL
jgi:hypothetical protein